MARSFEESYRFLTQLNLRNNVLGIRGLIFIVGKICLIASVSMVISLGRMANALEASQLPEVDIKPSDDSQNQKRKVPLDAYSIIYNTNMFGRTKTDTKVEVKTAPPSPLKLRLVAVNQTSTGERMAIIEDTQKQEQWVFDLNDQVFNQGKLVQIRPDAVQIEHGGKIDTVVMQDEAGTSGGSASGETASNDQTEFSVEEPELSAALANLPQLLSQARAVPYFRNGQSIGMRLFAIRSGSLYEKLGLKNGDIVLSVNDNSLSDPAQALKLFEQLKSERSVGVKLERNSANMDMKYSIR